MISRRNIRVKVMQSLYASEAMLEATTEQIPAYQGKALQLLRQSINDAADLFALNLLYMIRIAQYSETDARNRSSKYLPSQDDLNVNTKLAGNTFIREILGNSSFDEKIRESKLGQAIEQDRVKKMYQSLTTTDAYRTYISEESRNRHSERTIMQHIWNQMLEDEIFQEYLHDEWTNWDDDRDMIVILMGNLLRNHKNVNFLHFISEDKNDYAVQLVRTTIDKSDYCMNLIAPRLKNWDTDRVATIDIILLKMGICEFLYFPTIPTKVTINEYIEIAKNYSTPQSGQFINGVLDNLLKEFTTQNSIHKTAWK